MAISWYEPRSYTSIGVEWSASSSNTSVTLSNKTYRWDQYNTANTGGTFSTELSSSGGGPSGSWSGMTFGSGSGTRQIDALGNRTYTRGHSSYAVSWKVTCYNYGSWNGSFITLGTISHTWTYTIPAKPSYTIKYDANGGSGAPSSQTKWYGENLTLSSTVPTRADYTFLGWGTSTNATSATFAAGGTYTTNSGITLYAVWSSNTYTPNAPSGFSASRVSDAQANLSWTNNPSDHGAYAGIYVDRLADNGSWVNIANLGSSTTSYADTTTSSGHRYQYRIRSYNSAGSSSNVYSGYIYTTPKAFSSLAATKPTTLTVALTPSGMPTWYDAVEFQVSTNNGSSWSAASVSKTGTATWTDSNPPTGTVVYRGRSQKNSLYSSWVTSNSVLTVQAPNAPTVAALNTVYVVGNSVTVKWTKNHPDGTAQTKAQVEVTVPSGTTTTYDISGATTSYTFAASTAGTYKVRVRTYGLATSWGAWSSYVVTQAAYVPVVSVTNPAENDATISSLPVDLTWSITDSTGVSYQQLTITDSSGKTVLQTELASSVRSYRLTGALGLANNTTYTVSVYVRGGSSLTTTFTRRFIADWAQPDKPLATITYDDNYAAHIIVGISGGVGYQKPLDYSFEDTTLVGPITISDEGMQLGGKVDIESSIVYLYDVPDTIDYSIVRVSPDGEYATLISGIAIGTEFVDYIPPLNIDFQYIIVARAETGATSQLVVNTYCNSKGYEVFNFGTGASVPLLVMFDAQGEEQNTHGGESFHFATGEDTEDLPTFYPDGSLDVSGSHSYKLHSVSDYRNARAIARKYPVGWFRSYWGWVKRVAVNISTDYSAQDYGLWNISADITEQTWEEPYVNE